MITDLKGGLMIKKQLFFVLMMISLLLISACDIYNTLYVKQPTIQGAAVTVPEGAIKIEVSEEEVFFEGEEEINVEDVVIEVVEEDVVVEEVIEASEESDIVVEEEEISEEAIVIIVEESELISLIPKAQDPDNDALIFTFTSPLDKNGEWQTTYGDEGEYTITVTASDGTLTTSREVLIIVNKKDEAPVFDSFSPEDTVVEIDETETIDFEVITSDMNDDELTYTWKLDGIEVNDENSYTYETTYEDSGSHTVKIIVSDNTFDTEKIWAVTVSNVNREPILEEVEDIKVKETDTVVIELVANDPDGDELNYELDDERFVQDGTVFTWETTYDDAGEYLVTVSVSDGVDVTSQQVTVSIENVNRPPVIFDIIQK